MNLVMLSPVRSRFLWVRDKRYSEVIVLFLVVLIKDFNFTNMQVVIKCTNLGHTFLVLLLVAQLIILCPLSDMQLQISTVISSPSRHHLLTLRKSL
jgi:hypothetical protein